MERNYAGFWVRVVANIIDSFVLLPLMLFLEVLMYKVINPSLSYIDYVTSTEPNVWTMFEMFSIASSITLGILYYGLMTAKKQATIGKMVMGLQVIGENGEAISMSRAVGRYFSYMLSNILYIGYLMVAFSQTKQGLHDKICETYVVYKRT